MSRSPIRRRALAPLLVAAVLATSCTGSDEQGTPIPEDGGPSTSNGVVTACPGGILVPAPATPAATSTVVSDAPVVAPSAEVLDLATLVPLTGPLSHLAPAIVAAVDLAVADLAAAGGPMVTVRHLDAADGTPGAAAAAAGAALDSGVDVLIGPVGAGAVAEVLPVAARRGSVVISPAASAASLEALDVDGVLWRTVPDDGLAGRALAEAIVEAIVEDGAGSVALLARADDYGTAIADAAADVLAESGVAVTRVDHDPTELSGTVVPTTDDRGGPTTSRPVDPVARAADALVAEATAAEPDAIAIVGLNETGPLLDALGRIGRGAGDVAVYGVDGNLGPRLTEAVTDDSAVTCLRGLLPGALPGPGLVDRMRSAVPSLTTLDFAAEAYDATISVALASVVAGSPTGGGVRATLSGVTRDGEPCTDVAACLALAAAGADIDYDGASGPLELDASGRVTEAELRLVALAPGPTGTIGLTTLGTRSVAEPPPPATTTTSTTTAAPGPIPGV